MFPALPRPQDPFTSINLYVDARVAMKLKTKIWQQEYIDFGSLLVNPTLDGNYQLTIQKSSEGLSPTLALEPLNKPPKNSSIPQGIINYHINDVLNKNRQQHNNPVSTVPKKDIIILLPYLGFTKQPSR